MLQRTHHLRADRADVRAGSVGLIHLVHESLTEADLLGVALVLGQVIHFDGFEVTQPDMRGQRSRLHAVDFKAFNELFGEVQTRSRSSHRTDITGENRLITLGIHLLHRLSAEDLVILYLRVLVHRTVDIFG